MKRDMELVRELLILIEENTNPGELIIPGNMDRITVAGHLKIMDQAGLVENHTRWASDEPFWINAGLTWEGHDYLDAIRNDTVWNNVKEKTKEKGFQLAELSFGVLKEYAKSEMKNLLGLQ
ncbi:DUF2513 domain-containing protein [Viridibacillus arvi]|uniref:DUF2513 domain-containing protein n=1 Tax=Viridibacillus arvi TaxID=263475 RepID=UPI0038061429